MAVVPITSKLVLKHLSQESAKVWREQPLFKHIDKSRFWLVCLLHVFGAHCGARNFENENAIKKLCEKLEGKKRKKVGLVQRLLVRYMIKFFTDFDGFNLVHVAITSNSQNCLQILLENGADLEFQTKNQGFTPLHVASAEGNTDICRILTDYICKVNAKAISGYTPLHLAAEKGSLEIVQLLIENGASINEVENEGWTPLYLAAKNKHYDVVKMLIEKGGYVETRFENGNTALHLAAKDGADDVVRMLVARGANVNEKSDDGTTPLYLAANFGYSEIFKLLLQNG